MKNESPVPPNLSENPVVRLAETEARLRERTAELVVAYEQLVTETTHRQSLEAALTARNKELDTFVYRASHDLRGPLASLLGLTNLARLELTDSDSSERLYLEMIANTAHKLNGTLSNLLEITKIKYIQPEPKAVEPVELVREQCRRFLTELYQHNFQLTVTDHLPAPGLFYTDPYLVSMALGHLLDNAIRYRQLQCEQPEIRISLQSGDSPLEIAVTDNGEGLIPEIRERVFDMFFRYHERATGPGLGLYVAKSCIEKLGGTVKLSSTPGQGTTVLLALPHLQPVGGRESQ